MEILNLEINYVNDILKVVLLTLIVAAILGIVFKSKINIFQKYLSMFKFTFYLLLALLTYVLDVTVVDGKTIVNIAIPEELTIGQSLLILISILEAFSNFVAILKMPKSEFHLVKKEIFDEYKNNDFAEKIKIYRRIEDLEKELEIIKIGNTTNKKKDCNKS